MTRVLILDDRPINRQFLTTLLTYKGFETREGANGSEGLEIIESWTPDLAIVDIAMPGMDGIEFVRRVRAKTALGSLRIIFYTSTYEASAAHRIAEECGVEHVLMKPSQPEVILETIDKALGRPTSPTPVQPPAPIAASDYVRLSSDAMRISALIDFQLDIAGFGSTEDILKTLSCAARNIVASKNSIVVMQDGDGAVGWLYSDDTVAPFEASPRRLEHLRRLLASGRTVRTTCQIDPEMCALWRDDAESLLGVPLETATWRYGWLWLIDKSGAGGFTIDDERIALTMAAQATVAFENRRLYDEVRREAELLDRNVDLLHSTIEASGNGILVIDNQSRYVTFNRRFVDMWEVPEDIVRSGDGVRSLQYVLTRLEDPEGFHAAAKKVAAGQKVAGTFRMTDGRFIECRAAPRTEEGQVIGRLWTFRDVTADVRAAEALRQSEAKYRTLIANIPTVTWTSDAQGNTTFVSPNVEAMYGFTAEDAREHPEGFWLKHIHPEDVDRTMTGYRALFESGRPFDLEYRLQRKDGGWIWVHVCSVRTYERDGVIYADGVVNDITARKESDAELIRVARERELFLDSTGEGICASDVSGRCTMANRVALSLLGRTAGELLGARIHDLTHHHRADGTPYPGEECAIRISLRTGKAIRVTDEVFWRKDGTSFPVEYLSSPIMDDGVIRGVVVTFTDVTERRALERRLEQINRIDSLGRMAATIAHEFNNVLMGIQPFAELIRSATADNAKANKAAAQILNSVARGKGLTQDILRVTKAPEPALQSIDVTAWLEQTASEIRGLVGSLVKVAVDVPPPETLFARYDPAQMQQVLTNLAVNARDAMPGGGTMTISAERRNGSVRLVIADTGCGIPEQSLPFIFEPLFTTKRSGTGLGLAVAQQIVTRNGGTIGVVTTVGEGTRFDIDLPEGSPHVREIAKHPGGSIAELGIRSVVIVEDDPAVASGLSSLLELENVAVHVVTRGSEAMRAIAAYKADVVLIDMSLPDISGTTVFQQIAARWPHLPVIFSTGHADESVLTPPPSSRVGFLRKPYSGEMLLNKIREVI